jgi:hypothetical protein
MLAARFIVPRSSLLSQASTPPPRATPNAPASNNVTGVFPAPPFGLASTNDTGRPKPMPPHNSASPSQVSSIVVVEVFACRRLCRKPSA